MSISNRVLEGCLNNIENLNSYYAGGTLCIGDVIHKDIITICISDESFGLFSGGTRQLMSIENTKKAFAVYKKFRGENENYKYCFERSCIRHLV